MRLNRSSFLLSSTRFPEPPSSFRPSDRQRDARARQRSGTNLALWRSASQKTLGAGIVIVVESRSKNLSSEIRYSVA